MTYRGHVKKGVVVLDSPADLPDGAEVEVRLVGEPKTPAAPHRSESGALPPWAKKARELLPRMPRDLPEDFAEQHDHYIHGAPKR